MPDAGVLATILLIVGLFLLALELMIPSFGMIGICSAICLLISAWCAWQAWWGSSPGFFWTYVSFWLLGIPAVFVGMLTVMQYTSLGDAVVLRGPSGRQHAPPHREADALESLIGQTGKSLSLLTPGGMVSVHGERFHAESPGMLIEPETPVRVIAVKGTRLVVSASVAGDATPAPALAATSQTESASAVDPNPEELANTFDPDKPADDSTSRNATEKGIPDRYSTDGYSANEDASPDLLDFEVPENYTAES